MISHPSSTMPLERCNEYARVRRMRRRIADVTPSDGDFAAYADYLRESSRVFSATFREALALEIAAEEAAATHGRRRPVRTWKRLLHLQARSTYSLSDWLLRVTRGLWPDDAVRVEAEIHERYRSALETALAGGASLSEAHSEALKGLGPPHEARERILKQAYTVVEKTAEHRAITLPQEFASNRWGLLTLLAGLVAVLGIWIAKVDPIYPEYSFGRNLFLILVLSTAYVALRTLAGFFWRPRENKPTAVRILISGTAPNVVPFILVSFGWLFVASEGPPSLQYNAIAVACAVGVVFVMAIAHDLSMLRRLRSKRDVASTEDGPAENSIIS